MKKERSQKDDLPTIWRVPDSLWARVEGILAEKDPPHGGRPRIDQRRALDGMIFRYRSGVQWAQLPKEFGDDSSVHRTMKRWIRVGVMDAIWAEVQMECEELGGVDWAWQSADGALGKARMGGTLWARTRPTVGSSA